MKILVIGKGGREHALVWKLAQSPASKGLPRSGNAGTALDGVNVPIGFNVDDFDKLIRFVKKEKIGLTIVGPEAPWPPELWTSFRNRGSDVRPIKAAARIEARRSSPRR